MQNVEPDNNRNADRSKAVRLVEFLTRLARLRTKIDRDLDKYARVLWIKDIPQEKGCFTQAWGSVQDIEPDVWIEVQNRREPALPSVPRLCEDWAPDESTLRYKADLPSLRSEITKQVDNPEWQEDAEQPEHVQYTESLGDHPDIQQRWERYIEEHWIPWMEEHDSWEKLHEVYADLYAIHQEQLRSGEEFELVLGLGLLSWLTPTGHRVRRHLIVANALLEFEASRQKFTVRPSPDGASLRPELDMLDIEEQPAGAQEAAKASLADAEDDPWERDSVEGVLRSLVHSINANGEYLEALDGKVIGATEKPTVAYAPALILRKRSERSLTEALKQIKDQIEDGGRISDAFADLAEIKQPGDTDRECDDGVESAAPDGEVYFPKPWNEEQRRIVEKLRTADGVLVQGPPGTGKSHTIANLICHLLATGKRTLITAKTPRALQVLQELVPEELRPLCINLLGSGPEEKRSLEGSVGGMLRKHDEWNEESAADEREQLAQALRSLREEKAIIERRLRDIREAETHKHTVGGGAYQGAAARIAEAVNRARSKYEWFAHSARLDETCPVSDDSLRGVLLGLRRFTPDKRRELEQARPTAIAMPEHFGSLVDEESQATEDERRLADGADEQLAAVLSESGNSAVRSLGAALESFSDARQRLDVSLHPWLDDAVREIVGGYPGAWLELSIATRDTVRAIEATTNQADDANVALVLADGTTLRSLDDIDAPLLLGDVLTLKDHLESGGKLGWGVFRPKVVKERKYVLTHVRVNGRHCSTLDTLSLLAEVLRVHLALKKAWGFWATWSEKPSGPYSLQLRKLESACSALEQALSLEDMMRRCRESLRQFPSLHEPNWLDDAQIDCLVASCRLARAKLARQAAQTLIREIETPIESVADRRDAHRATSDLLDAIRERDVRRFLQAHHELQSLSQEGAELDGVDSAVSSLRESLPRLAEDMVNTCSDTCWDTRVQQIHDAWCWDQARYWVEEHTKQDDARSLHTRLRQIEKEIGETMSALASLHAWSACFSRFSETHRRHMKAWQQNVAKITKSGTGKQDAFHRKQAQKNLAMVREAIPAWVMPLPRLWETMRPVPEMFDVVIVDEASQCGFDALPLLFMAEKVVIVGDDKQISPEVPGVELAPVTKLINDLLSDFEHKAAFNIKCSLFDQGDLRYSATRIALREHFRCMPEIIRFSNYLCYSDTPLIPLRQHGSDRLEPLKPVFVESGYREGSGQVVVNPPEADAVVDKIVELCLDPRYEGKKMGVVCLQGKAQAGLIEKRLLEKLGAEEIEARRLICGEPYSFQGDERDIMFLSMVAAPNKKIGALVKPEDVRRFNVAASRARDQMWLFHSVRRDDLSSACLRRRLLDFFDDTTPQEIAGISRDELETRAARDNRSVVKPPKPFDSWFEVDVALALLRKGFRVIPQYKLAGKRIDLVVEGGQSRLAVECDGEYWHGAEQYDADMQRQRMLERCGLQFVRIRESCFGANREESLREMWETLEDLGINPRSFLDNQEPISASKADSDTVTGLPVGVAEQFDSALRADGIAPTTN